MVSLEHGGSSVEILGDLLNYLSRNACPASSGNKGVNILVEEVGNSLWCDFRCSDPLGNVQVNLDPPRGKSYSNGSGK